MLNEAKHALNSFTGSLAVQLCVGLENNNLQLLQINQYDTVRAEICRGRKKEKRKENPRQTQFLHGSTQWPTSMGGSR